MPLPKFRPGTNTQQAATEPEQPAAPEAPAAAAPTAPEAVTERVETVEQPVAAAEPKPETEVVNSRPLQANPTGEKTKRTMTWDELQRKLEEQTKRQIAARDGKAEAPANQPSEAETAAAAAAAAAAAEERQAALLKRALDAEKARLDAEAEKARLADEAKKARQAGQMMRKPA